MIISRVRSVSVGQPTVIKWKNRSITTAIFKTPIKGPVKLGTLNVVGDGQADLRAHGGLAKAVYAYPGEHYDYWCKELGFTYLPDGSFGENLTLTGLLEDQVCIGDILEIGTAVLKVTQPRLPCFKLGIRFANDQMVKTFLRSKKLGFYLSVEREGFLEAGNLISVVRQTMDQITVGEVSGLIAEKASRAGARVRIANPRRYEQLLRCQTDEIRNFLEGTNSGPAD